MSMAAKWISEPTWHDGEETCDIKTIGDLKPHSDGPECWCKPVHDEGMFIHNSMDGREKYETGELKAH